MGKALRYGRAGDESRGRGPRLSKHSLPARWKPGASGRRGFNLGDRAKGDLVPYGTVRGGEEQAGA